VSFAAEARDFKTKETFLPLNKSAKYITLRDFALSIRHIVCCFLSKLCRMCTFSLAFSTVVCVAVTLNSRVLGPLASLSPGDNEHAYYAERARCPMYLHSASRDGFVGANNTNSALTLPYISHGNAAR
jgi:hypothetical protein